MLRLVYTCLLLIERGRVSGRMALKTHVSACVRTCSAPTQRSLFLSLVRSLPHCHALSRFKEVLLFMLGSDARRRSQHASTHASKLIGTLFAASVTLEP